VPESVGRETAKFDRNNPDHVAAMKGTSKIMTDISVGSGGQFSFIRQAPKKLDSTPAKKAVAKKTAPSKPKSNLEKAMDRELAAKKNKLIK
jgi:hypothetical protein